jgi:hypothetical protein
MFDRANNELFVGDKVMIICCDEYPSLVGRIATVMKQDESPKVRVSFSDQWQGYFRGVDIVKYIEEEHKGNVNLQTRVLTHMIRTKDEQIVSILKGNDIDKKNSVIYLMNNIIFDNIEDKYKFLNDIDKSNEFNSRDWFFFGVVFSTQADKIKYSEG